MENKTIDWSQIYKTYKGLWVALDQDETTVISSAKDAKTAYQKAREKGIEIPILLNVPEKNLPYVGVF